MGQLLCHFHPLIDADLKNRGFRRHLRDFDENIKLFRGHKKTFIAYLRREDLLVKAHADDDETNYVTKDNELIARMPIVTAALVDDPIADLEAGARDAGLLGAGGAGVLGHVVRRVPDAGRSDPGVEPGLRLGR